jgi:hypothetical protein
MTTTLDQGHQVDGAGQDHLDDFDAGFMLGYGTGERIGWHRGRDEEREAWNWIIGVAYAKVIERPKLIDAPDLSSGPAAPCSLRCRRCSVCARFEQAWRNRRDHGSDDFPGGQVPSW